MHGLLFGLTAAGALGCALAAGVFFAFSSFVMAGLGQLRAGDAIAAMNAINRAAIGPAFMLVLFGTAAVCGALAVVAVFRLDESYALWLLAGAALYLVGPIGLTGAYHRPRNDALAAVEPEAADAARRWTRYRADWTRFNHVRAATALGAAAALGAALIAG